nr:glycosyltransferase [Ligilactobacillus salivarius]
MEQNNINVVYAADDNFIPVMGVSIVSLLKNNRDMSNINVTILATNVSELNKQKVNDLFNKYDRSLPRWIDATNIEDTLGQKVNQDRGSISQYARIFLAKKLTEFYI